MIAGGGTGGHIYPAIAIARALMQKESEVEVHFVGTAQGLEKKIVPRENFPLHLIAGGQLNFSGNPIGKLKTLVRLPWGFVQSLYLIAKYQPQFVLGVGGYASGPFVLAAAVMRRKTAIWEANVHPGLANRWLSRFVDRCFLVFEESKKLLQSDQISVLGLPVRAEMEAPSQIPSSQPVDDKFHVLHCGGSQGSRMIGRALFEAVKSQGAWTKNLKVVHQTGATDYLDFVKLYQALPSSAQESAETHEFIYNMPDFYRWADLVVCRGGAGTLSELAAFGLPALIIPLPAADGHQVHNAQLLVDAKAAQMILQKDLTPERLAAEIESLKNNTPLRTEFKVNIRKFHRPQAAEAIAKAILET